MLRVTLGPRLGLHPGVHGSLIETPPSGVTYVTDVMKHVFVMEPNGQSASPFLSMHDFEGVLPAHEAEVVHSARLPVVGCSSWVCDTDDFLLPVLLGRAYLTIDEVGRVGVRRGVTEADWKHVDRRCVNMLAAYAHESCLGILCRTTLIRSATLQWIEAMRLGDLGDSLERKLYVMYPAQRAVEREHALRKWTTAGPIRVLFCCGRDHQRKNGAMALRIFSRLARRGYNARFTYVGPSPSQPESLADPLLERHDALSRDELRSLMSGAHILFHPSQFETLGVVIVEAAAAGMGVVVARSLGAVSELLDEHGAQFVDQPDREADCGEARFEEGLSRLLQDFGRAREMGLRNYATATRPPWSLESRDRLLQSLYENARDRCGAPGVELVNLRHASGEAVRYIAGDAVAEEAISWSRDLRLLQSLHLSLDLPQALLRRGLREQ